MKKILFALSLLFFISCKSSEKKVEKSTENSTESSSLEQRLTEYMKLNDEMKLEQLMEYIYPKLFTLAPKEAMVTAMKENFNTDELTVDLDSVKVEKVYPVFEMGKGSYAKVDYSMLMKYYFRNKSTDKIAEPDELAEMAEGMKEEYGEENVSVDSKKGLIQIYKKSQMIAAKDSYAKEWSFVSLKEGDPMMEKLFSKELLDKLATYN